MKFEVKQLPLPIPPPPPKGDVTFTMDWETFLILRALIGGSSIKVIRGSLTNEQHPQIQNMADRDLSSKLDRLWAGVEHIR